MRVLVTGASGYVGSAALRALARRDIEVVAIGRTVPDARPEIAFHEVDLLACPDFAEVLTSIEASHLLHLAWYAEHGLYWTSPLNLRWTAATVSLVEAFAAAGGRGAVVAGTCAEYDWSYGYCSEATTPCKPATLYGTAKDATRRLSAAVAAEADMPFAWGRIFMSYGPAEDDNRLVPSLATAFRGKRDAFSIDAEAYRDFLHIDDVGDALVHLLTASAEGPINICSGDPVRIGDVARQVAELVGADPDPLLALAARRKDDPRLLVGDVARLAATGWRPGFDLPSGLRNVLEGGVG